MAKLKKTVSTAMRSVMVDHGDKVQAEFDSGHGQADAQATNDTLQRIASALEEQTSAIESSRGYYRYGCCGPSPPPAFCWIKALPRAQG